MTGYVNTGIVSVNTTTSVIVPHVPGRKELIIIQESNTVVRLGNANVAVSNGIILPNTMYSSIRLETQAAICGRTANGTANVSFIEYY